MPTLTKMNLDWLEDHIKNSKKNFIPTKFKQLDTLIGGLTRENITIIGARPGVGKTTLDMNIIYNMPEEKHLIYPTENPKEHWMEKFLSLVGQINYRNLKDREVDISTISKAIKHMSMWDLNVVTCYRPTIAQIRLAVKRYKPTVLHIDYFQNLHVEDRSAREYADKMEQLHQIAMDFKIPIILGSQLRRLGEDSKRVPEASDLKETGKLEDASKTILMLHQSKSRLDVHVVKANDGELGLVRFSPEWATNRLTETI